VLVDINREQPGNEENEEVYEEASPAHGTNPLLHFLVTVLTA
jgi:hypothetical protein